MRLRKFTPAPAGTAGTSPWRSHPGCERWFRLLPLFWFATSIAWCTGGCSPRPPEHGIAFVLALDTNEVANHGDVSNQLRRTEAILRTRSDIVLGLRPFIEPAGSDRLLVKVPALDSEKLDVVRRLLTKRGLLEFCMVHTNSEGLIQQGVVPPAYRVLKEERSNRLGKEKVLVAWLVRTTPERGLTGRHLKRAMTDRDPITGATEVAFEFDAEGAKLFEQITTDYQPSGQQFFQIGIVFDGELYSAPRIMGPIPGGRGVISGQFSPLEGSMLAVLLENPLESGCRIVEEKTF